MKNNVNTMLISKTVKEKKEAALSGTITFLYKIILK